MDILAYVDAVPFETANEALFYCGRAFEAMAWPKEMRADFFFDAPSCTPSAESRALTLAILAGIEAREGKPFDQLDKETLDRYSREIGEVDDILAKRLPIFNSARADDILQQMRASWRRAFPDSEKFCNS